MGWAAAMDAASSELCWDELTPENREERLQRHCVKTTQALFARSEVLKDVCFKCRDQEVAYAHKFLLGTQCQCVPCICFFFMSGCCRLCVLGVVVALPPLGMHLAPSAGATSSALDL